MQFTV
jgi:hypothetical protein